MAGAVLVVDDDVALAETLRSALGHRGVVIEAAVDAASACVLLDERSFCGVVLDLVLEEGGFDVLRHLNRTCATLPTIVVADELSASARGMLSDEQVKLVFAKPVDPRLLGAVVLGMCGIPN